VKVHDDEGVANHIGPESCAGLREGVGEALTGGCIGQPLRIMSQGVVYEMRFMSRSVPADVCRL